MRVKTFSLFIALFICNDIFYSSGYLGFRSNFWEMQTEIPHVEEMTIIQMQLEPKGRRRELFTKQFNVHINKCIKNNLAFKPCKQRTQYLNFRHNS